MNLLAQYLTPQDIALGVQAGDKEQALAQAATLLGRRHALDCGMIQRALWRREQTGSTAVGRGFAIPHARIPGISSPILAFLRLGKALRFGAPDHKSVASLFVILVPNYATEEHLRILAAVSALFADTAFRQGLETAQTPQEVHRMFCHWPEGQPPPETAHGGSVQK